MKILQLIYESPGSPFGFGGAGMRACEIYRRLKDRHDVTILCMKYPGAKDGEIGGLKHVFVGTEGRNLTRSVLSYVVKAAGFVRRHGNDFDVIVENFLPSTPFASRLLSRTPVILQVQGVMERHSLRKFSPFYSIPMFLVERFYPRLFARFIFVSEITKEKVLAGIKGRIESCSVIPNGVDRNLLEVPHEERNYILFFSRIDIYTKGLDLLMEAFEQTGSEYPDLKLILAGHETDSFHKLLSRCPSSLRERVEYAGFVTGAEKVRLLSGTKIFVLPSRHESAPVSVLEAAALGKPMIVSDIPELEFVRREGFGLSFPSGSAQGLAERMKTLLDDDTGRLSMGMLGREFAARFLWDDIARQFEDVLKHTVMNPEDMKDEGGYG